MLRAQQRGTGPVAWGLSWGPCCAPTTPWSLGLLSWNSVFDSHQQPGSLWICLFGAPLPSWPLQNPVGRAPARGSYTVKSANLHPLFKPGHVLGIVFVLTLQETPNRLFFPKQAFFISYFIIPPVQAWSQPPCSWFNSLFTSVSPISILGWLKRGMAWAYESSDNFLSWKYPVLNLTVFSFHCWGSELCFQRVFHQYSKLFSKRQQCADCWLSSGHFATSPLFHYFALPRAGFLLAFDLPDAQLGMSEILLKFFGSSEEFCTIHKPG